MKKLSRLTALLLALMMLVTSMPLGALADAVTIDVGTWNEWVSSAQQAATEQENETETVTTTTTTTVTGTTDVVNRPVVEASLTAHAGTETSAAQSVSLPIAGKLVLHAYSGAGSYQWQVKAGSQWANIVGDNSSAITLTYAKIQNAMSGSTAQVRCVMTVDGESYVSATAQISVDETVTYTTVETQSTLTVTAEQPVMRTYARTAQDVGIMLAAEEPDTTKYTVVINYVFADGKQAANPWTATVAAGSDLVQKVNSPSVLGYTPDQASVEVNVQSASQNVTYTVTYSAALVNYTVKHSKQHLNDDGYTIPEEETKQGYTESVVGEGLAKSYEGFYALLYDTATKIAADGSTTIEIYYDRYYYLMSFDLDGGYGVDPIYARYGATIEVGTPKKAGYTFAGWKDESTGTVYAADNFPYSTMPAKNTNYTAQWTAETVTFDVVYWYENADDAGYTQAGVRYDVSAVAGSVVNGETYADYAFEGRDDEHFTYAFADEDVVVSGDGSTVVNVYFRRNVYTLTFTMGNWASSCTVEEHRHTTEGGCYGLNCEIEVHDHSTAGCEVTCSHSHTTDCYRTGSANYYELVSTTKPTQTLTDAGNGIWTYTTTSNGRTYTHYYVNIGGTWYRARNAVVGGGGGDTTSITFICSHTHSAACYGCGKIAHTHSVDAGCYGLNCDKYEHYHSGSTCYLIVTAKYDADITDVWEENPVKGVIDGGYVFQSSVTGDYYSFLEKMPGYDLTMTKSSFDGSYTYTWYYYLEVLPNQETTGLTTRTDNGKTYYLYHTSSVKAYDLGLTYEEDYFPITGFTQRDSVVPNFSNGVAYLYYTRNSYTLTFSNNGDVVDGKGGTYLYQADISGTNFTPDYPEDLEEGAYVFEGWYTSPFYGDTKFEFTTTDEEGNTIKTTMPAHDVTLYARWVPTKHNVRLFLTEEDMVAKTNQIGETEVVDHGSTATEPADPTRGEYVFVGWFYMDGETEKAFDFSMPVNQDLDLYAKWSSNTLMEYTIKYAVKNADDTLTYIAEDTTGSALAGTTKTFEAKTGDELMEGYQSGYFPTTNSHSLTIDIENPDKNVYTFIYVPKEELPYTVKYLEYDGDYVYDGTETVLHEQMNAATRDAVITETFVPVTGYMPDAYQKRLVLSADETQNVIIFWYTKDAVHAPVQIIHYIQNAEGEDYTVYQESTDLNGVINQPYSADVLTITGFDYDHATANDVAVEAVNGKVTGTVTESGLILELYYNRELHPYEFKFLEQGTDKVLADSVTGTARYGAQVTQNYKDLESNGYELVTEQAQAITIQVEDGGTAVKNVRIFYYVEKEATINYRIVDPDNHVFDENQSCGSLTSFQDESIKVLTGEAQGSTATPASNVYKFVGWYSDAECTMPVDSTWVDGTKITPQKQDTDNNAETPAMYESATYYAKFEYNLTTLTIKKAGMKDIDAGQSFLFKVTSTGGVNLTIAINGNGSETISGLTVGDTVTVTEVESWSWRYKAEPTTIPLQPSGNEVTISNTRDNPYWLDGDCYAENVFGTITTAE